MNIVVNITRATGLQQISSFGTALLLIKAAKTYQEYANLAAVEVDYANTTDEYKFASDYFGQEISPVKLAIAGVNYTLESEMITLLTTLVNENKDFYAITTIETNDTLYEAIDDWIVAGPELKLLFVRTTSAAAAFTLTLSERSAVYFHDTADEYADAAILGKCLPKDPGSLSWNNQKVLSVTSNTITSSELAALKAKRMNTIILKYGTVASEGGFMFTDLYIDQRRSQDFVKVTMQNRIGLLLINEDKVPYDDRGIAQVVGEVEAALLTAFDQGIIAAKADLKTPEYKVTSQSRAQILANDPTAISDRILRSITFEYVEAGAIEGAVVNGTIVLTL